MSRYRRECRFRAPPALAEAQTNGEARAAGVEHVFDRSTAGCTWPQPQASASRDGRLLGTKDVHQRYKLA